VFDIPDPFGIYGLSSKMKKAEIRTISWIKEFDNFSKHYDLLQRKVGKTK
jgi:hypothetical protein